MSANVNTTYRTVKINNQGVSIAVHDAGGKDGDALLVVHAAGFQSLAYLPMVRQKLSIYGQHHFVSELILLFRRLCLSWLGQLRYTTTGEVADVMYVALHTRRTFLNALADLHRFLSPEPFGDHNCSRMDVC